MAGVTLVGELLALAEALGVPRDTALDALAAGPLTASVNRIKSTSSDFIITLAAKDLTLATDAADLPQLAAARDWLRTAAAEGAADVDRPRRGRVTSARRHLGGAAPVARPAPERGSAGGASSDRPVGGCGGSRGHAGGSRGSRMLPCRQPSADARPARRSPGAARLTRWRWAQRHRRGPGRRACPAGG